MKRSIKVLETSSCPKDRKNRLRKEVFLYIEKNSYHWQTYHTRYRRRMNKFIEAIKSLNLNLISSLIREEPHWLTWTEDRGKNALHYLCEINPYGDELKAEVILQILQLLLQNGMDMNAVDYRGPAGHTPLPATPLWCAASYGRNEMIYTWLLQNGAKGPNCLFTLASNDDVAGAEIFQQYGHTVENSAKEGRVLLLMSALMWPRYNMTKWLLVNGVDVNALDQNRETALFYAVKKQLGLEYTGLLLQYGADPDIENNEGMSPRKLAMAKNNKRLLRVIDNMYPPGNTISNFSRP